MRVTVSFSKAFRIMNTKPISVPLHLAAEIEQAASSQGVSVEEFVAASLEAAVRRAQPRDPLFADEAVFDQPVPSNLSACHDDYLYGDAP